MHPKPLQLLCIDHVVDATVAYQQSCLNVKKLWTGLQHAWKLPPTAVSRSQHLLHAYLVHYTASPSRQDVTRSLLTLLAVKADKIAFTLLQPMLSCLSFSSALFQCEVLTVGHALTHLDLTGVDLGESTNVVLTSLLPQCPCLTVLKLGGNTTPRVLLAARGCPLTVLHICERQVYSPRVTILILINTILGCRDQTLNQLFEQVQSGKPVLVKPFWPGLVDLNTGYCRLPLQLLVLVLVVYPDLEYLWSNIFGLLKVIEEYEQLTRNLPGRRSLSLKDRGEVERDISASFDITPSIEQLHVRTDTLGYVVGDALSHKFPVLRTLIISLKTSQYPSFLNSKENIATGSQISTVKLIGSSYISLDVRVITRIAIIFPVLEHLFVSSYKELVLGPSVGSTEVLQFVTVKSFSCVLERLDEPLFSSLPKFPKLQSLSVASKNHIPCRFWECLNELPDLRVLKLSTPKCSLDTEKLCALPRITEDKQPWVLYSPLRCFTHEDVKQLRNNGWSYFPLNDRGE